MAGHGAFQGIRIEQVDLHECEAAMHDGRRIRHLSDDRGDGMSLSQEKRDGAPADDARGAAHENLHGTLNSSFGGAMSPVIGAGQRSAAGHKMLTPGFFSI